MEHHPKYRTELTLSLADLLIHSFSCGVTMYLLSGFSRWGTAAILLTGVFQTHYCLVKLILTFASKKNNYVYDTAQNQVLSSFISHAGSIYAACFVQEGKTRFAGSKGGL
jgi:hypothetical protein